MGPLTDWMMEPIYCGAFHQSTNISTFCPGREYMTISFVVEQRHLENIDRVEKLIAELERTEAAIQTKISSKSGPPIIGGNPPPTIFSLCARRDTVPI